VLKDQLVQTEWKKLGIKLANGKTHRAADAGAYRHGKAGGDRVNLNNPLSGGGRRTELS
jgi:hypothetical protein